MRVNILPAATVTRLGTFYPARVLREAAEKWFAVHPPKVDDMPSSDWKFDGEWLSCELPEKEWRGKAFRPTGGMSLSARPNEGGPAVVDSLAFTAEFVSMVTVTVCDECGHKVENLAPVILGTPRAEGVKAGDDVIPVVTDWCLCPECGSKCGRMDSLTRPVGVIRGPWKGPGELNSPSAETPEMRERYRKVDDRTA